MAAQSPLVGYNTNVRHKGKLYHIQTEDSGVSHPHVITHLFADGGRIIASRKTAYAEHLGAKELSSIVKKLMQEQHKSMFIELRDCVYDSEAPPAQAAAPAVQGPGVEPAQPAAPSPPAPAAPQAEVKAVARLGEPPSAAGVKPARPLSVAGIPAPLGRLPEPVPPPAPNVPIAAAFAQAAQAQAPQASVDSQSELAESSSPLSQDDIDAFDRAAEARLLNSILGKSRSEAGRRGLGRYQQTVSANSAKPVRPQRHPSRSIFGGEALRGKSLDEVILSYLSDDAGDTER
jgi:hypothetical protein